jgi:Type ISP C-terminal specificity domain
MTSPSFDILARVPQEFKEAIVKYAEALKRNFAVHIPANPEDQLKAPVQDLLRAVAVNVEPRTEAQVDGLGARPDIGVAVRKLLCGYIELKAPGKGARTNTFKGANKDQWEKFKALPNLIYTDGSDWALYRSGELIGEPVKFSRDVTVHGKKAFVEAEISALSQLLLDFLSWQPIPPNSPEALARMLAPLCRFLREDVAAAVRNPDSALAQLGNEWRQYLFPDADDARFADAYAQTLTYALLLARLNGEQNLTTVTAAAALDSGHGLLANALRLLTQPEARNEIAVPVELLERIIRAVEPERLRQRGDPWLYFYEDFLGIYDPKLRNNYGVYYTPGEVIGAQVRLVSQLIREKFNKPLSYADDGVTFLDPGAGTAAYPLAAIEHALEIVEQRYGEGMVAAKATDCANNFNAFEILVGPYAVAHLRLTKLIQDMGGTLPKNGIRVFLTDTLESPHADPPKPPLFVKVLTEEHRRAQHVKNKTRIFVCMGNPPYDREQEEGGEAADYERKGGWVRHGDPNVPGEKPILLDFSGPAKAAGAGVHLKNIYNDYVYFWRWALWKLFENPEVNGPGIISFITASSYLRGPGFVGMRQKIREAFDELWIIDLEGDQHGARKTENVFAIQTPVAIAIGVRYQNPRPKRPAEAHYTKITGTREEKLDKLRSIQRLEDVPWRRCFNGWMEPLLPDSESDYRSWPLLTDLFPWQHSGVQFKRTWPIGETAGLLEERWRTLIGAPADQRGALMRETGARKSNGRYKSILNDDLLPPITELPNDAPSLGPIRYAFRSFDRQWVLPDARFCDRPRPSLWRTHGNQQIYLTSILADILGSGPAAVATALIPDLHHFSGRGGKDVIPLYRDSVGQEPNVCRDLLGVLGARLGERVSAEAFFCYTYAVLATPAYAEAFDEELTVPGPRVPITKSRNLFDRAVDLGRRLIRLHTYGERFVEAPHRRGEIPQGRARCVRGIPASTEDYPEDFFYESATETLRIGGGIIAPISLPVFQFSVSNLSAMGSWLSYRMKKRAGRFSSALDEIRPEHWTGEMTQELLELVWVLEATVALLPEMKVVLGEIIAGEIFGAQELPQPADEERLEPGDEEERQHELAL